MEKNVCPCWCLCERVDEYVLEGWTCEYCFEKHTEMDEEVA